MNGASATSLLFVGFLRGRLLQRLFKERVGALDHLVEPHLSADEGVGGVRDDGEVGLKAELLHALAEGGGVRAGIVVLAGDEPDGRVGLIEMMQGRGEAVSGGLVGQGAAQKLPPDFASRFDG